MAVRDTSRDAHANHPKRGSQAMEIAKLLLVATNRGVCLTIGEMAHKLGWEKSTVSGRRNDLEKSGYFELEGTLYKVVLGGKRPCTVSGITCYEWKLETKG